MRRHALTATAVAVAVAVGSLLARGAFAGDKSDKVVFPQGNEQPLAALQDIDVIEHLGDRVPAGLSFRDSGGHLVAFDDLEWAEAMSPPLTAAAQPFHAIGARAVQLLTRRLDDPLASREIVRLPASLEHRHSCGCGVPLTGSDPSSAWRARSRPARS